MVCELKTQLFKYIAMLFIEIIIFANKIVFCSFLIFMRLHHVVYE